MSTNTKIEWTEATWNPVKARLKQAVEVPSATRPNGLKLLPKGTWGYHCERVSEGCRNCYAERMNGRTLPAWGTGLDYTVPNREKVEIFLDEEELQKPLHWKRPRMIFPCSMTDWCAEFVTDHMRDRKLAVCALTPQHTYQFLTKRAKELQGYISGPQHGRMCIQAQGIEGGLHGNAPYPIPNVWLGVSVENRAEMRRIDHLRQTPAALRFLSLEPLLEDLGQLDLRGIDWVIVGGESGPGSRPCDLAWVRSIVAQCAAAGVPCFVKQLGVRPIDSTYGAGVHAPEDRRSIAAADALGPHDHIGFNLLLLRDRKGGDPAEWPADLRVRQMPTQRSVACS